MPEEFEPQGEEDVRAARDALAAWARSEGLNRSVMQDGERWSLPRGTVALWFYPPTRRSRRGLELNLLHLRTDGHEHVADAVAAALEDLGVPVVNPDHPSIPYAALAQGADDIVARVLSPYLDAYRALDAGRQSAHAS